jgi:hypothetical protein
LNDGGAVGLRQVQFEDSIKLAWVVRHTLTKNGELTIQVVGRTEHDAACAFI